jgi:hypothetical protein
MTEKGKVKTVAESEDETPVKQPIVWHNVILLTLIHLLGLYSIFAVSAQLQTVYWSKWYQYLIFQDFLQ